MLMKCPKCNEEYYVYLSYGTMVRCPDCDTRLTRVEL